MKRKLARLKQIVGERERWREKIELLKRMKQWVLDAEHILDGVGRKDQRRVMVLSTVLRKSFSPTKKSVCDLIPFCKIYLKR